MVRIPTHPNDPHQPRPAIIASLDSQNRHRNLILVIPLSTSISPADPRVHILIPKGEGGLTKDTHALCDLITSIDKQYLIRSLGNRVQDKYRIQLIAGVRIAMGDPDPALKQKVF